LNLVRAYEKLGKVYEKSGHYERAGDTYKTASELIKDVKAAEASRIELSRLTAHCYYMKGLYKDALKVYTQHIKDLEAYIKANNIPPNTKGLDMVLSLLGLGEVYHAREQFDKALETYDKADKLLYSDPDAIFNDLRNGLINFDEALTYIALKDLEKASSCIHSAQTIYTTINGENNLSTARASAYVGYFDMLKDELESSESYLNKAKDFQETFSKTLDDKHPNLGETYEFFALLRMKQGKFDEAAKFLKDAFDIKKKALGEGHPEVAQSYEYLATLQEKTNKPEDALKSYEKCAEVRAKALKNHPAVTRTYEKIASIYVKKNDNVKTLANYKEALKVRQALAKDAPETAALKKTVDELAAKIPPAPVKAK